MKKFKFCFLTFIFTFATFPAISGQSIADSIFHWKKPEEIFKKIGDTSTTKITVKSDVFPNKEVTIETKLIADKVLAIQLPCPQQKSSWQCGYHTFINSGILARNNDYRKTIKDLYSWHTKNNIESLIKAVGKTGKLLSDEDLGKFNFAAAEKKNFTLLTVDAIKELLYKGKAKKRAQIPETNLFRSYVRYYKREGKFKNTFRTYEQYVAGQTKEDSLKEEFQDFAKRKKPVIFLASVEEYRHIMALKAERMKNGWIAIVYADSLGRPIWQYKDLFKKLAEKIHVSFP